MLFRLDSKITQFIEKIADLIILSMLWAIATATVICAGPAGVALYHVSAKSIRKDRKTVTSTFFEAIRDNWKAAIPAGILLIIFLASAYVVDFPNVMRLFSYNGNVELVQGILSVVKILLVAGIGLYLLPILSRFRIGIVRAIAFSVMFVFRHLITTVCVIALLIFAIVLIVWQPVLIMIVPGLYGLLWSAAVDRILKRYMREDEKTDDGVVDRWYLE